MKEDCEVGVLTPTPERVNTQEKLSEIRQCDPWVNEILSQTERMCSSDSLGRGDSLSKRFLTSVVHNKLLGNVSKIREKMLALEVWGDDDFDPLNDPKVRVAAKDLEPKRK